MLNNPRNIHKTALKLAAKPQAAIWTPLRKHQHGNISQLERVYEQTCTEKDVSSPEGYFIKKILLQTFFRIEDVAR